MNPLSKDRLKEHQVLVTSDNSFQQRARLLQAIWREASELPIGVHRGTALGSRLAMPRAIEELFGYLTPTIREVVRTEVEGTKAKGKLYGKPRIYDDLLSSQPLCFNLFGELQQDLSLATRALLPLAGIQDAKVTRIEFEHSPGRRDPRFTNDRSAFDVFVEYQRASGTRGFLGLEVKYHEDLKNPAAKHRSRYDEIARAMGCFKDEAWPVLQKKPLQQIWRDHLLACSMLVGSEPLYSEGRFVFMFPELNERCRVAVESYRKCLCDEGSFSIWTLEEIVAAVERAGAGAWIQALSDRYLSFAKLG